jgi:hypothetical protein
MSPSRVWPKFKNFKLKLKNRHLVSMSPSRVWPKFKKNNQILIKKSTPCQHESHQGLSENSAFAARAHSRKVEEEEKFGGRRGSETGLPDGFFSNQKYQFG